MRVRLAISALLFVALLSVGGAQVSVDRETQTFTNMTNRSADTFFVENASAVTSANLTARFATWGHSGIERRGGLWDTDAEWNAGTHDGTSTSGGSLTVTSVALWENFDDITDWTVDSGATMTKDSAVKAEGAYSAKMTGNFNAHIHRSGFLNDNEFSYWIRTDVVPGGYTGYYAFGDTGSKMLITIAIDSNGYIRAESTGICAYSTNTWYRVKLTNVDWVGRSYDVSIYDSNNNLCGSATLTNVRTVNDANPAMAGNFDVVPYSSGNYWIDEIKSGSGAGQGNWTSDVKDTGIDGTQYQQLRWNATGGGSVAIYARANNSSVSLSSEPWTLVTTWDNSTACPCSTGTNLSNLTGRYFQVRVNLTFGGGVAPEVADLQFVPLNSDVGKFSLNGNPTLFVAGSTTSVSVSHFVTGTNGVEVVEAQNLSYFNLTLDFDLGGGVSVVSNAKPCMTWRNLTAHTTVNVTVTYSRTDPTAPFANWNATAILNGTIFEISNRTNATAFNFTEWNDSSTIYVRREGLPNGSTYSVLVDQECLNATAIDETTGASLASFRVQQIGVSGGLTKTGGPNIVFNGTEVVGGGGATRWRANATGYELRDFSLDLPDDGVRQTFPLLSETAGVFVVFTVVDPSSLAVPGASVSAVEIVSGVTVGTGTTDDAGAVRFFLDPFKTYQITVSPSGFQPLIVEIQPTQTTYTLRLGVAQQFINFSLTDLEIAWSPETANLIVNNTTNATIRLNVTSPGCLLLGGSLWAQTSFHPSASAQANGTCQIHLSVEANVSDTRNRVSAGGEVWYLGSQGDVQVWRANRTYAIRSGVFGNTSLYSLIVGGSAGLRTLFGPLGANLSALVISLLVVMLVAIRVPVGMAGGGAVFLAVAGFFMLGGVLDTAVIAIAAVGVVGLLLLRRFGR